MHPSNITPFPTEVYRLIAEREKIRATQTVIEAEMLTISQRLRDLREAERDLTIRLVNAHFTSAPSVPSVPSVPLIPFS